MRDGNAPNMALWLAEGSHRLVEWETDLSSQTGASQAGILLGSNDDIPAFRWVDKPTGQVIACSGPADCEEIEQSLLDRHRAARERRGEPRKPALRRGRRGDPHRQPRVSAEKKANPGYRAFFANGFNVTRTLVLFFWEIVLECRRIAPRGPAERAAARSPRRACTRFCARPSASSSAT